MSDWGQGFPRHPPGMVLTPQLPGWEHGVVEARHRTQGRSPDLGAVQRPRTLSPQARKAS